MMVPTKQAVSDIAEWHKAHRRIAATHTIETKVNNDAAPELLAACRDAIPFVLSAIRANVDVPGFDPEQHVLVLKLRKAIENATK